MRKLRILFTLLSFGVGTLSTVPFHNHKNLLNGYLRDRATAQRGSGIPESVVAAEGTLSPRALTGFGGSGATVEGDDHVFTIITGDNSSYSGTVNFRVPYSRNPHCIVEGIIESGRMATKAYEIRNAGWFINPGDVSISFARIYISVPGSHFPPHSKINVLCE